MKKRITALTTGILLTAAMVQMPVSAAPALTDLVSLQKWLLGASDTTAEQTWDLTADGKIDVTDLCQMKRQYRSVPDQEPLNALIGMDYATAVTNAYISRSEYGYQIAGNLKSTIEEKMGRPLDYSIDRFYLVNNETLGLDENTKYLYNASTMDVYPVTEETKRNCATWYWKGSKATVYGIDDDEETQNEFLDALEWYGITEVYYSSGANKLVNNKDTVEKFVKNAYQRNMKVYLLTGEKTWLSEDTYQTAIYRVFDKVEEYNSLVDYDARLAGVSYDVEVWTNSEYNWKNNADARAQQVKFIETAQQYAAEKNLSVIHCLPFWIVRYDYTAEDGTTKNVYDSITQIANDTILMTYRDSASAVERLVAEVQTGAEHPILYYAEKNDCNLEIAVQIDQSKEGDSVSFYEEELEQPGCVKEALSIIQTDLEAYSNHTTFAIHQAIAMYERYLAK